MKIDISPRASGKTTRAIEWLKKDEHRLLITFSYDEENRLKQRYPEIKNQFIDWESYLSAHDNHFFKEVAVDNAEMILQKRIRQPLALITMTNDNPL